LSQIFVISMENTTVRNNWVHAAQYYDMMGEHAFGNYRELLEAVTYHPLMGEYLTYLYNDGSTAANPDENYAREILQLFSIGLHQLDIDGSRKPGDIPTYTIEDLRELSKVFTGFKLRSEPWGITNRARKTTYQRRMEFEASRHRAGAKSLSFLKGAGRAETSFDNYEITGTDVSSQTQQTIANEITQALDCIYNHPNVAPFVSKRLIQHFVTSNPSPDYVERVATVFNDKRSSTDQLAHVIKAVLLDPEARQWEQF